jgi:hypothetical protein
MRCVLTACALLIAVNCLVAGDSPDSPGVPNLPDLPSSAAPPPPPEFPPPIVPDLGEALPPGAEILPQPDFSGRREFTRDATGFDFPFCAGFGFGFPSLSGRRILSPEFTPLAEERFPAFNQPGLDAGFMLNAGLTYRTGGFGALTLGYRVFHSDRTIAQVTLDGPLDPLVIGFLNEASSNEDDGAPSRPVLFLVPDNVGSCLASSQLTLHQLDLSWSTPPVWLNQNWSIFAQLGVRAASFLHEDSTTSLAIFQQAKERFAGVGPVGGMTLTCLLRDMQLYCTLDSGELFGAASQLDREMAILKHSTRIVADSASASQNVTMLGVEAGIIVYSSDRLSAGIGYRFDQWWNLVHVRETRLNWSNHSIELQFRWRL